MKSKFYPSSAIHNCYLIEVTLGTHIMKYQMKFYDVSIAIVAINDIKEFRVPPFDDLIHCDDNKHYLYVVRSRSSPNNLSELGDIDGFP